MFQAIQEIYWRGAYVRDLHEGDEDASLCTALHCTALSLHEFSTLQRSKKIK